ncbi:MAG: transglycosylase domain-containing protein [Clostridia bacterium]
MKKVKKIAKISLVVLLVISISVILIGTVSFLSIYNSAKLDANAVISKKNNITLYSIKNEEISNDKIARYIPYSDINQNIINAFVSLEDKRFYKHKGVDYYRTAGAMVNNVKAGYTKEGGSTITQQLAKNTQLSSEKTYVRKIKEMKLASDIENKYTKEQILEYYLNAIYFGNGVYGIDSACKTYFNKSPTDINITEAAFLAGIVKNPSNYSPKNNPEKANERKNLVISLMKEQEYITEQEYAEAYNTSYENYDINSNLNENIIIPYYANALSEASEILGLSEKEILENGYKIYTFYDENEQKILSNAFESGEFDCPTMSGGNSNMAVMLSKNIFGGITSYYSNFDQSQFYFKRQPASTIKPILTYASAVESGKYSPISPVIDEEINIDGYSPKNYGGSYLGKTTFEKSLMHSSNTISVKLLNEIGIDNCKAIATKMGVEFEETDSGLSLALGGMSEGVNFHQLNSAYMCLANQGKYIENSFIRMIYDSNGALVYAKDMTFSQAISPETAYLITSMLCNTAKNGTAKKLSSIAGEIAAKTGTNSSPYDKNFNFDSWCISYTPKNTLSVWYGDLDNTKENSVGTTGGNHPALLSQYVYKALGTDDKDEFKKPMNIISLDIDKYALENDDKLYLSNIFTPEENITSAYFNANYAPYEFSPYFDTNNIFLEAISTGNFVEISFNRAKPFDIRLFRQNVFNGEKIEIPINVLYDYDERITIIDRDFEEFTPYEYSIELSYEGKIIDYTPQYIVFT